MVAPPTSHFTPVKHKALITVSIMLATIMQALDTTIANVALPHMQGALAATQEQISWVLTSYIVAAAIMTSPTGIIAAKIGRKPFFLISVIGFTVSSVFCGIAANLPQMVVFRLLQGVFGAALVPLSQAVLLDINPPEKHGPAMAVWGVGVMLGPILGPTLGGWLTESYSWRWVFFINVPIGIIAAIGMMVFLPDTPRDKSRRFDVLGFILLSLSLGLLQMMLDRGETKDWFSSMEIILEGVTAAVAFYLFVVHILTTAKHPFLDPVMFRDRNYLFCLVFIFIFGIILLATMALLPPFLENLMNYPVLTTGLVLAPRGVGTMAAMLLVGKLMGRIDVRALVFFGLSTMAYSLWTMSHFSMNMPISHIVSTGLVQGFGMGFVFVPLSTIAYATLPPHFRNDATAIYSLVRNIGSSVGIAVMTMLLARNMQINHAEIGASVSPYNPYTGMVYDVMQFASGINLPQGMAMVNGEVTKQAAAIAYLNDFYLMTLVTLTALPLLFFMKINKRASKQDATTAAGALE